MDVAGKEPLPDEVLVDGELAVQPFPVLTQLGHHFAALLFDIDREALQHRVPAKELVNLGSIKVSLPPKNE